MRNKKNHQWMQISDLHIGKENNDWEDSIIRKRILDCINRNSISLDFIVITGDIFHKGEINEKNSRIAKELISEFKKLTEKIVFCIGNHDFTRTQERTDKLTILNQEQNKNERGKIFSRELKGDFEKIVSFYKDCNINQNPIETGTYVYQEVEGLNVVVLNTSIFAGNPKLDKNEKTLKNSVYDDGKLWFSNNDLPQIEKIDFAKQTIVVGHHTIQMFDEDSQSRIIKMFKELHAIGYFCGHMHRTVNHRLYGVNQYTVAGTFSDDYNIPTMSVFALDDCNKITQKIYIYKNYEWVENYSIRERMQQIPIMMKNSIKKLNAILSFEKIPFSLSDTLQIQTEKNIESDTNAKSGIINGKEDFVKTNIAEILKMCVVSWR